MSTLSFSEYQRSASETSQLPLETPQNAIPPMLGLSSEAGAILDSQKRFLRERIDLDANKEFLREELGDLLWYTSAVATACGLNLEDIASANLARARDLYVGPSESAAARMRSLPSLDAGYPDEERFPRVLVVRFVQRQEKGRLLATVRLVAAKPNPFPQGAYERDGKKVGFTIGDVLGGDLTDNSRRADAYRFHDAVHMAFMAVLGWSPTIRALLRLKRKSNPSIDEAEDGARARYTEEGLSAVLSRLASRRLGFRSEASVDGTVIEIAKAATKDFEVESLPGWVWRRAISQGFEAMKLLSDNAGGFLTADLDRRELVYSKHQPDLEAQAHGPGEAGLGYTALALRDALSSLHAAKSSMYGDAWKKRGEVLSILSNLARKVDRLEKVLSAGTRETADGETNLDTVVDLFVYCLKHQTYLADQDAALAAQLFPPETKLTSPFSDTTEAFDALVARRGLPELEVPHDLARAVSGVIQAFAELEKCYSDLRTTSTPRERLARVQRLASAAVAVIEALARREPGSYRRFLAVARSERR